jgi:hypothetical protein
VGRGDWGEAVEIVRVEGVRRRRGCWCLLMCLEVALGWKGELGLGMGELGRLEGGRSGRGVLWLEGREDEGRKFIVVEGMGRGGRLLERVEEGFDIEERRGSCFGCAIGRVKTSGEVAGELLMREEIDIMLASLSSPELLQLAMLLTRFLL